MICMSKVVYVDESRGRFEFEQASGQYVLVHYWPPEADYGIRVFENGAYLYTIPWSETNLEHEIAKWVSQYSETYNFQYSITFFEQLESEDNWIFLECDVANRVVYRQRVFTRELVNFYVISMKENYYNPYELDLVNVYYLVDRTQDFLDFVGKTWMEFQLLARGLGENILVYKKTDAGAQQGVWAGYNKRAYKTVYDTSNTEGSIRKVFQIWDIEEVNDLVKRFDDSLEGTIVFNNLDNEIIVR